MDPKVVYSHTQNLLGKVGSVCSSYSLVLRKKLLVNKLGAKKQFVRMWAGQGSSGIKEAERSLPAIRNFVN
jgi:hypothetical protein